MIAQERVSGNWNRIVGAVKKNFGQITNDDLTQVKGNVDQLIGMIQTKTDRSREQIEQFLSDCCRSTEDAYHGVADRVHDYSDAAGEVVRENYERMADAAGRGYDQTVQTISRRPMESLAVAVGAGALLGFLIGMSMTGQRR